MATLDLKKPGKLNATAENAKDFTFWMVKAPYETSDLEGGTKVKPDDVIFSKENVAGTKVGANSFQGIVDLAPEAKKLSSRLDELEKKLKVPIIRVYAYCVATSLEGAKKLAAACELKITRPELELKVVEPAAFNFNYKEPAKNVVEVKYEADHEVKSVKHAAPSDGNFKFDKETPGAKTPEKFTGSFTFKAEKPGIFDVPITAESTRDSIRPVTKWVTLEAVALVPDVQIACGKTRARIGDVVDITVTPKGCTKIDIKCEPAGIFEIAPASVNDKATVKATAKKAGNASIKALGFIGAEQMCDASIDLDVGETKLDVTGDGKVAPGIEKAIMVEFDGLDSVDITFEPAHIASADKASLGKSDVVKVKGLSDGKCKLKAAGKIAGAVKLEKSIDIECLGPTLRIFRMEYKPA